MKNKIYITIVCLLTILLTSSCFQDKSSLDTNKIDQIVIETPSMPSVLRVEYLEDVTFEPTIKLGDKVNPEGFTYRWEINNTPGNSDMVTLSTDKKLQATITSKILSSAYTLVFTVTDRYGIEVQKSWPVYVSSAFREGIVVADTKDGVTSDLSLIMDQNVTTSYSKDLTIKRDIWKTATGSSNNSLIKSVTYALHKASALLAKNMVVTITENNDINMYDCENYSLYKNAQQIFPAKSSTFVPQAFYTVNNAAWLLVANNKVYCINSNGVVTSFVLPVTGTNNVNNAIVIPDNSEGYGPLAFWYDNTTGKIHNVTATYSTPAQGGEYTTQGVFNPANLPDRNLVAGDMSIDGRCPTMLMKNNVTGNYELYAISVSYEASDFSTIPSTPKLKADLPSELSPIINSAVSVFFCMFDPIMYVATSSKIYAVNFGGGVVSYSEKYSAPSGEQITRAKLYMQGRYRLDRDEFNTVDGPIFEPPVPLNTKAILVATQKSTYEGNIYLIPQASSGNGTLDATQAKKYTGFGKILDFTIQGQ